MVLGLIVAIITGQSGANYDLTRAVALWKEFGRFTAVDEYFWNSNPSYRIEHFEENRQLSAALVLAGKGDVNSLKGLAKNFSKNSRTWDMHDEEWLGSPKQKNLEGRTAMLIYKHLVNQYLDREPPNQILKQLRLLQKKKLIDKQWKDGRNLDDFVRELAETVKSSGKPPGTIEYAIDSLVDISDGDSRGNWQQSGWEPKEYKAIEAFGLDAIPALLLMLGSKKLSHSFEYAIMNRRAQITHVDSLVRDLIFRMTDGELASGSVEKQIVLGWLAAKRKGQVKEWIVSRLFVEPTDYHPYGDPWAFESLGKKYPYLLKWAYEEMIRRRIEPSAAIVGLKESNLSREAKLEILDKFLALDEDHVGSALSTARELDQARYDRTIARYIGAIPIKFDKTAKSSIRYALGTDNPEIWKLVKEKIDQGDTLMKMHLISHLGYGDSFGDKEIGRVMRLLIGYFDSKETVPPGVDIKLFDKLSDTHMQPGLTVGQVALETASTKGGGLTMPNISRTDRKGWEAIRKRIEEGYRD